MKAELFFGYPLTEPLRKELEQKDPRLITMFVNNQDEPYLKVQVHEETVFLGKEIGNATDINKLRLLQANIYSILTKIHPSYPFKEEPLFLFATIYPSSNPHDTRSRNR